MALTYHITAAAMVMIPSINRLEFHQLPLSVAWHIPRIKIHFQPDNPATPFIFPIAPARRPPKAPDKPIPT